MSIKKTGKLVDWLTDIRGEHAGGRHAKVVEIAQGIAKLADQVGLITISKVARDVAYCAGRGDDTAYQATFARLLRIGEGCVTGAFDFSDQYI